MLEFNRRRFLAASAAATAAASFISPTRAQESQGGQMQNAEPLNLAQPGQRDGKYLERDGARIFYQTFGEGSPMVLLHGYPLSGALFARVVEQLSQNHLIVTIDHRGYGQSETPQVPDSVDVYAEDAIAVMDELGLDQAVIGGMSMGGPIAFSMYEMAPDRFSGLVLIDTIAAKANPAEAGLWNGVAEMVEQKGMEAIIPFLIPDMLSGDTRLNMPEQVEYLKAIMSQCSQDAGIGGAKALANRPDRTALLSQIDVPTLILVGMTDAIYPFEIARMMQSKIEGSQVHIVPGAAHAAIFEAPDDAATAIGEWAGAM